MSINSTLDYCTKKINFALYFDEKIRKNKRDRYKLWHQPSPHPNPQSYQY